MELVRAQPIPDLLGRKAQESSALSSASALFSAGLGTNPVPSASSPPLFFHPSCILDSSKAKAPFPSLHSLPSTHTARQIYTPTAPARMFLPAAKPTGLQVPSLSDPMGGQGDPLVKESPVDLMHSPNNCIKHICRGSNVTDTTFSSLPPFSIQR